jgi:hypothetical protein
MGTPAKRIVIKYGTRKAPAKSNYHHRDVIIATKKGKKSIQSTIIQIHINSRRILRRNQNGTKKSGEKVIDYMEVVRRRKTPPVRPNGVRTYVYRTEKELGIKRKAVVRC